MINMEEQEIRRIRLRLIDLVKSFFSDEPDAEKISRWRGTFSALSRENVNPMFDQAVHDILMSLKVKNLEELQNEYYKLFTDPFTDKGLCTSASFYLDGRTHGATLINIRTFLRHQQIVKNNGVMETEDSLPVMLDILIRLIEEEEKMETGNSLKPQEELLDMYLLPFSAKLKKACEENEFADFYKGCCLFFCGCLELEKGLTETVVSS
jgi:TorA maturation chaperone TorD